MHISTKPLLLLSLVCGTVCSTPAALAQEPGRVEQITTNSRPYYFFLKPGEATRQIYVWGSVASPGLYEIGTGVELDQLLSLAGGPLIPPRDSRESVETTIRLFRGRPGSRELVFEATVEGMVREPETIPLLSDFDVVTVESVTRRGFSWRDGLSIATALAALALAYDRIVQ